MMYTMMYHFSFPIFSHIPWHRFWTPSRWVADFRFKLVWTGFCQQQNCISCRGGCCDGSIDRWRTKGRVSKWPGLLSPQGRMLNFADTFCVDRLWSTSSHNWFLGFPGAGQIHSNIYILASNIITANIWMNYDELLWICMNMPRIQPCSNIVIQTDLDAFLIIFIHTQIVYPLCTWTWRRYYEKSFWH